MGMFDYVTCEIPLPGVPDGHPGFQTKDTDAQYLERYTIKADGSLIHHAVRYEDTPLEERRFYDGTPEFKDSPLAIVGMFRSVPTGDVAVPFHGRLSFYDRINEEWFEFDCLYDRGSLLKIERNGEAVWPAKGDGRKEE